MVRGSVFCGRYTFLDRLHAGDRGEIWRAFDARTSREVAFRLLRGHSSTADGEWQRLERAHATSLSLAHALILDVEPPLRSGGRAGQAMELTLRDAGSLLGAPLYQLVPLLFEVAKALAHAHGQSVFHRDLRIDHILIAKDGSVRLGGFGRYADDPAAAGRHERDDVRAFGGIAKRLLVDVPKGQRWLPLRLESLLASLLDPDTPTLPGMRDVVAELDEALHDTAPLVEYIVPHNGVAPEHHDVGKIRTTIAQAASTPVTPPVVPPVIAQTPSPGIVQTSSRIKAQALPPVAATSAGPRAHTEAAARALGDAVRGATPRVSVWRMRFAAVLAVIAIGAYLQWLIAPTLEGFERDAAQGSAAQVSAPADAASDRASQAASLAGPLADVLPNGDAATVATTGPLTAIEAERATIEAQAREAAAALERSLGEGERALDALDEGRAATAFRNALSRDPGNAQASRGLARARRVGGIRGVMLDARSAEARGDYGRALQGYAQALANDPPNRDARASVDRLREAVGLDDYGRAMSDGYIALGSGKLEKASEAFALAQRLRPTADAAIKASIETGAALAARESANRLREAALASDTENR